MRLPGIIAGTLCAGATLAQPAITVERAGYAERLRGMWLGECIANWTGLRTEGARTEAPFFTDADWGTAPGGVPIDFVLTQNPWLADDDTDIEYVYLHTMSTLGHCLLTPGEISDTWLAHMNPDWIWVSNRRAYDLMGRGVRPPMTGGGQANIFWAFIDAQLTTELFGALCPGMPEEALRYADLPIRSVADGYAVHAAQFYVVLYSLAPRVDPALSGRDKALWLVREARKFLPDSSKSAGIVDFVLEDFLANPDPEDWELTRDRVAARYQSGAAASGFVYRGWPESSVNFACGVMCLLYGRCDYRRTVQIGTLSGWDSDNCTATMGGLLGLMLGEAGVRAQFPGVTLSGTFNIHRTRLAMPDYLPQDPEADDTFELMAGRMMPLVDQCVVGAGGSIDGGAGVWKLPAPPVCRPLEATPGRRAERRSQNLAVRAAGGAVTVTSPGPSNPGGVPWVNGTWQPSYIANGIAAEFAGMEAPDIRMYFFSTQGSGDAPGMAKTLQVEYDREVEVAAVRFIEGEHFGAPGIPSSPNGGWFGGIAAEVRVNGVWVDAAGTQSEALDAGRPFQVIDIVLPAPVRATGVRVRGVVGGSDAFVTCSQVDALGPAVPLLRMNTGRAP